MEVAFMARKRLDYDEVFKLVTKCRQSGLSDHQWCVENNIKSSTFYTWISRLRELACYEIPDTSCQTKAIAKKQDVVKVEVIPDKLVLPSTERIHPTFSSIHNNSSSIEIQTQDINIRVDNSVNPMLLAQVLQMLKVVSC